MIEFLDEPLPDIFRAIPNMTWCLVAHSCLVYMIDRHQALYSSLGIMHDQNQFFLNQNTLTLPSFCPFLQPDCQCRQPLCWCVDHMTSLFNRYFAPPSSSPSSSYQLSDTFKSSFFTPFLTTAAVSRSAPLPRKQWICKWSPILHYKLLGSLHRQLLCCPLFLPLANKRASIYRVLF